MSAEIMVRPDAKGRISLGKIAAGISSFKVMRDAQGRFILEPFTEIPAREAWLFGNKLALDKVKRGLRQSAKGKLHDLGSFANHADDAE